jgi:hypothetical protein
MDGSFPGLLPKPAIPLSTSYATFDDRRERPQW